jgi:pimeloyl-ACP methyl ester carboxylesterase
LILIHGYNNDQEDASRSYERFRKALRSVVAPDVLPRMGATWEFHWPGDHPVGPISMVTFSARVGFAQVAGVKLAQFFEDVFDPRQRISIVAHSLGCRVALETIGEIRSLTERGKYRGPSIGEVFLLAAAVPEPLCEQDNERPFDAPFAQSREYAFYSRRDRILRGGFRIGESLVGESGPAVGWAGGPPERWHYAFNTHHDHGDYWESRQVAFDVAVHLGLVSQRRVESRLLDYESVDDGARQLDERDLVGRALAER